MTIKLTKDFGGKKADLNLLSINGKTYISEENFKAVESKLTKKDLKDAGIEVLK